MKKHQQIGLTTAQPLVGNVCPIIISLLIISNIVYAHGR